MSFARPRAASPASTGWARSSPSRSVPPSSTSWMPRQPRWTSRRPPSRPPPRPDVGQSITVNWQATDQSSQATTGNWQDSVYLSATPAITSSSTLLGMVPAEYYLGRRGLVQRQLDGGLARALAPGYYYVLVQVDSLYQLPDPNRANNTLAATTGELDVTLPALTLGTPSRFVHRRRSGQVLPGHRAGRRIAQRGAAKFRFVRGRGALRQPGNPAHPVRLPGSGRDRQSAEPDGGRAAGPDGGNLLHPGPQRLRSGRHGRLHAHRHADRRRERVRHLALLGRQRAATSPSRSTAPTSRRPPPPA